jgi:CheY-like chemotaxis protein
VISPKVFNVNNLILDLVGMIRRLIGEQIELVVIPAENLALISIDPSQMEHILVNLAVNARDAMPHGGKITIRTENAVYADKARFPAERYVKISVSDTGTGMSEEVKANCFEPFYTTKEADKSTGLGLATVHASVTQNKGVIELESEEGRGTTFHLIFPQTDAQKDLLIHERKEESIPRGHETVLVAEDEESVRQFASMVLAKQGYRVLTAGNGEEALRILTNPEGERIDLLVTDMIMPRMGGRELAENVRKSRPEAKVLFMSGYTDDIAVHEGVLSREYKFLQKPFTYRALAHKVREVLDESR